MKIEKRVLIASVVFVLALLGVIAISVRMYGIGLPTCLTDVRPFNEPKFITHAPDRYEIHYVAKMWNFEPGEVELPPGSSVDIYLSTPDVTHGMQIVGTNVNLMAVPGAVNFARVKFNKPGQYHVICNEYCGIAHHSMAAVIRVTETPSAPEVAPVQLDLAVLDQYDCTACHSTDGSEGAAATFKGLLGSRRQLENGSTVIADQAYIRESIVSPNAKMVKDAIAEMPEAEIPPEDLEKIVQAIKSLQ